ncbi:hypothetical protein M9H77_03538 [Catharanthus roseus]|uniref:Uncharacterized protein n=1 Tax=Catharanthus roseus TaxID=4058 RepID=A0ACC0CBL0_CATRO|nr:hypothetical protein M9H77_03538 [Catharanthus roseus]
MKYCESPEYKTFCKWNKRNKNEGSEGVQGVGKHTGGSISFMEHRLMRQAYLTDRFFKSRNLEELHKHQTRDRKGVCGFSIRGVLMKFHEARQKAEEEVVAIGTLMPDDLQLLGTIAAGSEAVHLKAESNRAPVGLPLCCLEVEQRIMRRVEAAASSVCAAFDDHIRATCCTPLCCR